ncbi:MAG: TIGR03936 family radical SAM-associated protein [Lachnospiraceae bacterium]|nr:TIGR03936 family radical SAM-associated protein [Lachnospiraceae bacterium]
MKIRIKFAKEGTMKFIGHLDIMRYFQKVMRRADVNIRYSGGFSPHQIMSFAAPLGVGMESRGEYVDIEVLSTDSSIEMMRRINAVIGEEMEVLSYRLLPDDAANAMSIVAAADYIVSFRDAYAPSDWDGFASGLQSFLNEEEIMILKKTKKGEKEMNLRPLIYELTAEEDHRIRMKIATGSAANIKPDLVIRTYMETRGETLAEFALKVTRTEVYGNRGTTEHPDLCPLADFGEDIE